MRKEATDDAIARLEAAVVRLEAAIERYDRATGYAGWREHQPKELRRNPATGEAVEIVRGAGRYFAMAGWPKVMPE